MKASLGTGGKALETTIFKAESLLGIQSERNSMDQANEDNL